MNIKKLLKSAKKLALIVSLASLALCAEAQVGVGPTASSSDFLSGNQALFITNSTTYLYGGVGYGITNAQGVDAYSNTNLYSTNGFVAPGTVQTNLNAYYGNAWNDLPSFSTRDGGNASTSITVKLTSGALLGNATNILNFRFEPLLKAGISPNGQFTPFEPATGDQNAFVFSMTMASNGVTTTLTTNIPTALMQGAMGWRCVGITNLGAGGTSYGYIQMLGFNGYRP